MWIARLRDVWILDGSLDKAGSIPFCEHKAMNSTLVIPTQGERRRSDGCSSKDASDKASEKSETQVKDAQAGAEEAD
jgi:hypothetical protein